MAALYRGGIPALLGIAPYMALELAAFDSLPQEIPSFVRGFSAALVATSICYPLDTVRRQMQLHKSAPFFEVLRGILNTEVGSARAPWTTAVCFAAHTARCEPVSPLRMEDPQNRVFAHCFTLPFFQKHMNSRVKQTRTHTHRESRACTAASSPTL